MTADAFAAANRRLVEAPELGGCFVYRTPDRVLAAISQLQTWPGGRPNADFVKQLEDKVDKSAPVLFICRSGGRSHNAAMMAQQAGYAECYNVLEGFEGDKDASGHRSTKGGWRFAGLPWTQS